MGHPVAREPGALFPQTKQIPNQSKRGDNDDESKRAD